MLAQTLFGQYPVAVQSAEAALAIARCTGDVQRKSIVELELLSLDARRLQDADTRTIIDALNAIARRPEVSECHLLRASRLLAAEADNICDRKTLMMVRTLLARRFANPPELEVDYQMTAAILEFADGEFFKALEACERIIAIERMRDSCIALIIARRVVTVPLLRLGRTADAIAHLSEAYAVAANLHLWSISSRLADRMSAVYFLRREREESLAWLSLAAELATKSSDMLGARSILNQRIKSDAHFGTHTTSTSEVMSYSVKALADYNIRRRTEDLAAILHFHISRHNIDQIIPIRDALTKSVSEAHGWMDLDYAQSALTASSFALGDLPSRLEQLPSAECRSRQPQHWCLGAAAQANINALYENS